MKEIQAAGGQIAGISYDSVEVLKRFAASNTITFPLLSDAGSKTIDAYGIRNTDASGRFEGIPHPGTFIIDRQGVIRNKLFLEGYRERHETEELLNAFKQIQ